MLQIEPGEAFLISHQLSDPSDTDTYYVRAYVYDDDGTLLTTVDLTDKGGQLFQKKWYAPSYKTAKYVTIIIKAFTDSGYTTESTVYPRGAQLYRIQQVWQRHLGGGGINVNYEKIRELIQEELDKLPRPISPDKVNLKPILKTVAKAIKSIDIPKPEKIDLRADFRALEKAIESVQKQVKAIYIPPVDFSPLLKSLTTIAQKYDIGANDTKKLMSEIKEAILSSVSEVQSKTQVIDDKMKQAPVMKVMGINDEENKPKKPKRQWRW